MWRRRAGRVLISLSLLLGVAAVALWARSYSGSDYLSRSRLVSSGPLAVTSWVQQVTWTRGSIRCTDSDLTYYPHGATVPPAPTNPTAQWGWARLGPAHVGWDDLPGTSLWCLLGFYAREGPGLTTSFSDEQVRLLALPAWLPVAILAAPVLWRVLSASRIRRRRRANLCPACGYDLTGNVSGVCPECGKPLGLCG